MGATIIIFLILGLIVTAILISPLLTKQRRNQIKRRAFPPFWQEIIANNLPIYHRLTTDERRRLQGHIQVFLVEKQFIGCQGLQVTAEMKLTIAAFACLLLLNEREEYFPKLRSILIYPSTYVVNETVATGDYFLAEKRVAKLGESWSRDQLILSWAQVQEDTQHWNDGHNVVLHEFAHQLDQEDGKAEGVPILPQKSDYAIWAQVMTAEYQRLCHDVENGFHAVIDSYGATHPAEFFAVATETFFEKPLELLQQHPALYELLQRYYQVNPRQWVE
ncbi:zinc-dependent peptidase [Calothrix sp. NIES-2100]|uniref:zinc-dependent peptidase n=1 Tax=Calothrix sp. NIES-2100 TaxID=1954172 RepID=UPI000BBCE7E6